MLVMTALGCGAGSGDGGASSGPSSPDATPAPVKHLVYLHGRIIEDQGVRPTHPRYGTYEYREILDAFTAAGFEVDSDVRPAGTIPLEYAELTAHRVRELIDAGVPPSDITVVGFSKGGVIAVLTALALDRPDVNYVFIACCGPWIDRALADPAREIRGRMLSLYEASDSVGSCSSLFDRASADSTTAELELHLGGAHGAFYRPHSEWIDPVIRWATGDDPAG